MVAVATYEDLTPLLYFDHPSFAGWSEVLVAVGWLGEERSYRKGGVEIPFIRALVTHLRNPWQPVASGGSHLCEFCRCNEAPPFLRFENDNISMGCSNVFIPGDSRIYYAPSAILHYIDAHEYRPPERFCDALLRCPPQNSMEYKKALLKNGGGRLLPSRNLD